ncbi:MAG: hypothetical protein Q9170_002738 [Blastenia crenularia]
MLCTAEQYSRQLPRSVRTYRLNDELEQHNPSEPSTTACPLLPGQQVNVLEVPIQIQRESDSGHWSQAFADRTVFTLDPKAKYSSPVPFLHREVTQDPGTSLALGPTPTPVAEWHDLARHSTASTATFHPLERTRPSTSQGPCVTFPNASSLKAIIQKLRGTRSVPTTSKWRVKKSLKSPTLLGGTLCDTECYDVPIHPQIFENVLGRQLRAPVNTPEWPLAAVQNDPVAPWTADSSIERSSSIQSSMSTTNHHQFVLSDQGTLQSGFSRASSNGSTEEPASEVRQPARRSVSFTHDTYADQSWHLRESVISELNGPSDHATRVSEDDATSVEQDCLNTVQKAASPLVLPIQSNAPSLETSPNGVAPAAHRNGLKRPARPPSLLYDKTETLATFLTTSPSFYGQLSPHYLSQPESPSVRDFEEAWESGSQTRPASTISNLENLRLADDIIPHDTHFEPLKMPQLPSPGFQGYSLPEPEYSSTATVRKPASANVTSNQELSKDDRFVHSWNDAPAEGYATNLDELVDDLGYLGQVIV